MTVTHTPGPWTLNTCAWLTIVNEDDDVVALVPLKDTNAVALSHARARLIAKAPEMREVLALVARMFDTHYAAPTMNYEAGGRIRALLTFIDGE